MVNIQHQSPSHQYRGNKNPEDAHGPFFRKQSSPPGQLGKSKFFPKRPIFGIANDRFEQEADQVADKVVNQKSSLPLIQEKRSPYNEGAQDVAKRKNKYSGYRKVRCLKYLTVLKTIWQI